MFAQQINERLTELKASTDHDPYSGITAEDLQDGAVRIFDDYDGGQLSGERALEALKALSPIDWKSVSNTQNPCEDIWEAFVRAGLV